MHFNTAKYKVVHLRTKTAGSIYRKGDSVQVYTTNCGQCKYCQDTAATVSILLKYVHTWLLASTQHVLTRSACVNVHAGAPWVGIPCAIRYHVPHCLLGYFCNAPCGRNELHRDDWELGVKLSPCNFLHPILLFIFHNFSAFFLKSHRPTWNLLLSVISDRSMVPTQLYPVVTSIANTVE